ncbi:MAG: ABC transporter permease [Tissierellales bacterium]|jgi:peptide/nickel transport system permease protein|nr:ABC transporter permease [Tissierellales bacterium]
MKLRNYIMKRILHSIFVLIGLSILIFIITRVIPGDPVKLALGPRASEAAVESLERQLNLDKPLLTQYFLWFKGVLVGDFGMSLQTRMPVIEDITKYLPATLELIFIALIIETIGGILLGVLSAKYSGTWFDGIVRVIAYIGVATPAFVWAVIFMLLFGFYLEILPTMGRISTIIQKPPSITGFITIDSLLDGNVKAYFDALKHLIMPSTALALGGLAQATRITRSSMTEVMEKDYVWSEISAGIPMRVVMIKYILRPSLIPTVSIIALDVASMVANAFLVELVFNYPGLSRYGINAMLTKDINSIIAVILVIGIMFILLNILVDIIVAILDPRIKATGGEA